jgi:hypothetical protein
VELCLSQKMALILRSPFTTDPDSSRVRNMVRHYLQQPFLDDDGHFGDLTIYIRK